MFAIPCHDYRSPQPYTRYGDTPLGPEKQFYSCCASRKKKGKKRKKIRKTKNKKKQHGCLFEYRLDMSLPKFLGDSKSKLMADASPLALSGGKINIIPSPLPNSVRAGHPHPHHPNIQCHTPTTLPFLGNPLSTVR